MGGQEECSVFDASPQARILNPSSERSLSAHDASFAGSRKRKWDNGPMEDLLDDSFIVKPHPSTVFTRPRTLRPIALLPRSNLPLSCIDTTSTADSLPASRLFEAHVKILELETRMGTVPMVLIASSEERKSFYAVERDAQNLCAICKLGSWVNINTLCALAVVKSPYLFKEPPSHAETLDKSATEIKATSEPTKYSRRKRLAIEAIQSMVKRPSKDLSPTLQDPIETGVELITAQGSCPQVHTNRETIQEEVAILPTANEIMDNIRLQYFEALYLSKSSLAYFAKGPLSRARAAFHLDYDSMLDMNDLIGFLESLVLTTNLVDKKYKDGIPNLVSTLITGELSADEIEHTASKVKKPKGKKMKPRRNGLYPTEETYVRRWWASHDTNAETSNPRGSKEEVMKSRVAQLRIRETQLQMIVILETLALQPLATRQEDHHDHLPSIVQDNGVSDQKTLTCSKIKKPLDLAILVDVHVDRLCIWQSLLVEGEQISPEAVEESKGIKKSGGLTSSHEHTADVLREFCVEVVVPFFSARLPEQCGAISRKLGGPVVVSPVRPKLVKSSSSGAARSRPGTTTKRPVPSRSRRSLQRVLTDERRSRANSVGSSGAISLMRSATAPAVPGLKREESEAFVLGSIPFAEAQSMHVNRGGVMKSKKFSQREVDLSNLATGNECKMKKTAIEVELKEAISALKRPNRQLAGQIIVETAERRAASASMNTRKSKKPVRNPSFQGVQILSTPKGNRYRDTAAASQPLLGFNAARDAELEVIPPSSLPRIPLSVARSTNARHCEETPLCKATPVRARAGGLNVDPAIQVTPCQARVVSNSYSSVGFVGFDGSPSQGGKPPHSPLHPKKLRMQQSLEAPFQHANLITCTPIKAIGVQATPMKQRKDHLSEAVESSNQTIRVSAGAVTEKLFEMGTPAGGGRAAGESIYESLGWDDFDDMT